MPTSRRKFLVGAGLMTTAGISASFFSCKNIFKPDTMIADSPATHSTDTATDETFWKPIQDAFLTPTNFINLNNGGVCPQPLPVQESHQNFLRKANEAPAFYILQEYARERALVKQQLAGLAGCNEEEISLCRNTTEALETVIFGLDLQKGDEIITTTQDYPTVMAGLEQRVRRDGIKLVKISIPTPAEDKNEVVRKFKNAITPKTKLIVVCHINFTTGQIMPVREICDMAHEHGVEVAVDGAHAFAHLDFKIPELHCDYFGTSLHKWLCAPFGCGLLYVKKEKVTKVWSLFGSPQDQNDSMLKFEHLGTRNFAAEMAITSAIEFHNHIGIARKEARLRFLKDYWTTRVKDLPNLKFHTSLKKEFSCGLCLFQIEGMKAQEMYGKLMQDYKIFTTMIKHEEFEGIRVTPHVYTKLSDLDKLVNAISEMAS